jgi:cyclic beta-1,2-glucan synthetase
LTVSAIVTPFMAGLKSLFSGRPPGHAEAPLRAELFSADQMAQHGRALAAAHRLAPDGAMAHGADRLLARLAANETTLVEVCKQMTSVASEKRRITPAGEWLLDNFYLIEEQIRTAKRHLPKGYSRELPRLAGGPSAGHPRVYDIALETVAHGDGRVDTETLYRFVAAYQSVIDLRLGELWAIPIMLRLAVIENLRRVAVQIAAGSAERDLAALWAERMIDAAERDPKGLILVIADMARSNPPMVSAFVAELARRLQGRGPALALPLTWVEQHLAESGQTIAQQVQLENQQQAADQVSISNSIGSLRVIGAMDWRKFVETLSVVERALLDDPQQVYGGMDFASRDRYRHATERIARQGNLDEGGVARHAVALARAAAGAEQAAGAAAHVGHYLIGDGLPQLERQAEVRHSFATSLRRVAGRCPLFIYLGAIALGTGLFDMVLLRLTAGSALPLWSLLLLSLPLSIVGSQLALSLVNWLAGLLVMPQPLPKMDYDEGIPADCRTLVVVPTMLVSPAGVDSLVEALEVRFLANRDPNVCFALLGDFLDAAQESLPADGELLQLAVQRIDELNAKYRMPEQPGPDSFFLLHRPRRWNAQENAWMGHERKRGKLAELNALLRNGDTGGFLQVAGDVARLVGVRYVITLDTDTQLPRDAARQFVGAMAHPLNRPRYDAARQRVVSGYGILQPRVAVSLPGTNRSRLARLYGGEPGIDPYTRAVSDVYQDVFGEGSFIGKGIYDVDAFEQALASCFPENRILSHDLLEGCYARAGLLSDVQLYEDSPASYRADVLRRQRWMRGDWQLAGWLLRRVPGDGCERRRNPLSALSQWKLFDNLRRSLLPVAITTLLLVGWLRLPAAGAWTLGILGSLLLPPLLAAGLDLCRKPAEVLFRQHLAAIADGLQRHLRQLAFEIACLPYEALLSLDAIGRTGWRLLVSQRHLLEWNPSSEVERQLSSRGRNALLGFLRLMWVAPALALASGLYLACSAPPQLAAAAPLLLLWLLAPATAWWLSRPLGPHRLRLDLAQHAFLRRIARRTWGYFEHFVGPDDNWLAPDNYQEYRVAALAHRTSPTNMGLALLANLAAYDFGYIPAGGLLRRTGNTLQTMQGLARYRGHFYNWYDTQTLQPMPVLYISTVDSGNLAGHLLTLRSGLLAVADEPLLATGLFVGLGDTLGLLAECAEDKLAGALAAFRKSIDLSSALPPQGLPAWHTALLALRQGADELVLLTRPGRGAHDELLPEGEAAGWARAIIDQLDASRFELDLLAPWVSLPPAPAGLAVFAHLPCNGDMPSLRQLAAQAMLLAPDIERRLAAGCSADEQDWLLALRRCLEQGSAAAAERLQQIDSLARQSGELAEMDYGFLFDHARHLLTIGYNVADRRVDTSYYDLLASEARLCNFVAIAQGQLPQESWFSLGRLLTGTGGEPALLSWSGSMFEYLMPMLVMPNYDNTLLDQTCKAAVARQIEYGRQRGVPWGISESGYNTVDVHLNYQYRAFGVPGLGLKRGLADDLVIAPYASALALMVAPEAACHNLQRLASEGCIGKYGFFEAIDYTPARQRRGQTQVMVRSFMAHHQGMSLLALDYLLQGQPMQKRFMADRLFQAIMLLLQERIPRVTTLFSHTAELADARASVSLPETPIRVFTTADTPVPEVQLLSNGRYHVMLTNAGGGYSRWNDLAVTRWREDGTRDHHGTFCYIRELASGTCWSTSYQPTLLRPAHYEAIFSEGRAEFRRRDLIPASDSEFETYSEIVVSPEDDIEIRRTRITNRGKQRREIDVTSYGEVVMAAPAADALHPAFSNLFVESEIVDQRHAILCSRRPRSIDEKPPWMLHLMAVHGIAGSQVSYETDRLRFIGRGNSTANAQAMRLPGALSGAAGSVLDPVVAIRHRFMLAPEQSVTIDLVTGVAESRAQALALVEKYQDRHLADRVFDLTWTHSQVVLRQLNASEADAQLYARLAGSVIHAHAALRAEAEVLVRNRRGQSGLWGYAISGDLPIVLLQIGDAGNIDLVRQVVQAHAYWRLKGLTVDLVIWNEDHAGYRQRLQEQIMGLIASGIEASVIDRPGGIFVRQAEQISGEDRILLQSVARAVIADCRGTLAEQLDQRKLLDIRVPRLLPSRRYRPEAPAVAGLPGLDLQCFNGLGGFAADGREYVITLAPGQATPAPWANVLANPGFGTVISESGSAYTWSENAHEFRLTPWANDPVGDAGGEAIYLRDEETGQVWSPTPWPVPAPTPYVVRHGFGYSEFATQAGGIHSELRVFVAVDDPVKFSVLTLHNRSGRARRLSATAYVEWVLGDLRARSAMHINSEVAPGSGALYARNPYSTEFAEQVAFFDIDDAARSVTGDRAEFLGRNGSPQAPAALQRMHLSGRVGAGLDPCGAIQLAFDLADGESRQIVFRLGVGRNVDSAARLVQRYRGSQAATSAFAAVGRLWQKTLGAVQVETPDPAFNLLANGWLVYQTLACRLWARSGYYQSGGAFGFRDQLQDVMALVHAEPALVRAQLLLSAGRQFVEGDVQHWWHPPSGRGVRTRCSDDYLWLPLAVCRYVGISGDRAILDERRDFLEGRPVNAEDDSYYDLPGQSGQSASLYEHCVRAIRHGLRVGSHGLPLMGSGDWNDGMNRVGVKGQGESVWLGFFLCEVLHDFSQLARLHGDPEFAEFCQSEAHRLGLAIEAQGWDGAWYRRAYFDDGQPLGASQNEECQIDSIAQSWSVLSGVAPERRARQAMQSLDARLVDRAQGLVQLLDPPFDLSSLDPGYIRGYVPGVRENGGQYTHAAIWAAMAFARQGDTTRAWELATMINPLSHAGSPAAVARYKVEPYVMAADVYARAPHAGRGGWTWYTGSAGWMYRLLLESLLGLRRLGDRLHFAPCLPAEWSGFTVHYRYRATRYHITVSQVVAAMDTESSEGRLSRLLVDGVAQTGEVIELVDDAVEHHVELRFTPATASPSNGT